MPEEAADAVIPPRQTVLEGEEPRTVTATVVSIARRAEPGIFGHMVGLETMLHVVFPGGTSPHRFSLSRLVGEYYWLQDAHFGPNGMPHFVHGFGSRCTKKRDVVPELAALLDEAARAAGLVVAIGDGVPLELASDESNPTE